MLARNDWIPPQPEERPDPDQYLLPERLMRKLTFLSGLALALIALAASLAL